MTHSHTLTHTCTPCRYKEGEIGWKRDRERNYSDAVRNTVHAWSHTQTQHTLVNACIHTYSYIIITGVNLALGYLT